MIPTQPAYDSDASPPLASIIIANYNYSFFVAEAIESALAVEWWPKEIIVVDDGSTDNSFCIIEGYIGRGVQAFRIENGGQAAAAEFGFYRSKGHLIMFLDSDDVVDPSAVREAVLALTPTTSKVQFQMRIIDSRGTDMNGNFPTFPAHISPTRIRRWVETTDSYPTPPGSGNVYTRHFLEKIFPLDHAVDRSLDSFCLSTAPFLGDVISIPKPLVSYRIHGRNDGAMTELDVKKISRNVGLHLSRCRYATQKFAEHGIFVCPARWRFGFYNLLMRVASLRLAPTEHPIAGDTFWKCMRDASRSFLREQGYSPRRHFALFACVILVALLPQRAATRVARWRYAPSTRPELIKRLIRAG